MSGSSDTERRRLSQGWALACAPAGTDRAGLDALDWQPAEVPGTAASSLRALGHWDVDRPRDFDAEDWWWKLDFEAPGGACTLGFDGLATLAEVWLDGDRVLTSDNMFRQHRLALDLEAGTHTLLIRCRSLGEALRDKRPRPRWRVPMLDAQQLRWFRTTLLGRTPGWSPPCAPVGPWRGIWLQPGRPAIAAHPLHRVQLDDSQRGSVQVQADCREDVTAAELVLDRGDQTHRVALDIAHGRLAGTLKIDQPELWWPHTHGEPALYRAAIEYHDAGGAQRMPLPAVGFRRLAIDRSDGAFDITVNDVSIFCRGACWTPADPVSLDSDADTHEATVARMREAGFNMLRIGGTMVYPDEPLLDALDRHGVLLWQDLMFANMDYPDDPAFATAVAAEVDQVLDRLSARPSLALVCGNSEAEQQAAMAGAPRELWSPPLFHRHIAEQVAARGLEYVTSSATGGAFPHAADRGPTSYFGVGAYLRPLEDARRSGLRFASECLAFANVPPPRGLPGDPGTRVHQPLWKTRAPRDLGAGWDFDDVRDHYVRELFGIDPGRLRVSDHERYLALGRAASGEVMARCFGEWRRAASPCGGALVWFLRDLWTGAGWGLLQADGQPKACWHALARVLAPRALHVSDEGVNGLVIHAFNDRPQAWQTRLGMRLYRGGDITVAEAGRDIEVPAHGALALPATDLLEGFADLSWAYRFGPAMAEVVHVSAGDDGATEAWLFPAGLPSACAPDIGLSAAIEQGDGERILVVSCTRFAQSVEIDAPGLVPEDNGFHLAPGHSRRIRLGGGRDDDKPVRGQVQALNSERGANFKC